MNSNLPSQLPSSLQRLISSLHKQIVLSPRIARQCVINAQIKQAHLLPWADFEHSVTDSYGRQLVYEDKHLEIMVASWIPGDFSAIHDHGSAQWGAVQCFGNGEDWVYKLENNLLSTCVQKPFLPGTVIAINQDLIHQMGNPSESPFLSLHVYGCEEPCDSITGNARVFDLWSQSIQYTNGGAFFCLPEEQINSKNYGLKGDQKTTLHHHHCLRDRLRRILSIPDYATDNLRSQVSLLEEKIALLSSI